MARQAAAASSGMTPSRRSPDSTIRMTAWVLPCADGCLREGAGGLDLADQAEVAEADHVGDLAQRRQAQ